MCKIVREGGDTGHGISLGYGYIPRGHISSSVCPRIENEYCLGYSISVIQAVVLLKN